MGADNKAAAAAASSSKRKKGEAKADAGKEKAPAQQDLLKSSILYGVYMATSSNLRYQFLAGVVEQRMLKAMFKSEGLRARFRPCSAWGTPSSVRCSGWT